MHVRQHKLTFSTVIDHELIYTRLYRELNLDLKNGYLFKMSFHRLD